MTTIKTYQEDVYLKELTAIVFDVTYENGVSSIICDRTIFFPTGGGQPCDIGYINDFKIYDVSENKDGLIIHRTTDISDEEAGMELLGTEVNMKIDWSRRFRNMQRHLGEHLLSGSFYKLFGGTNKGFHMGEDYITIDIALPDGLMTESMIFKAELDANKVIQENLPVSVHYFKNSKEAGVMPVRKAIDIDGPISVVMAGNAEKTADCVACCGTHPSHTGEVGLIKIYKFEPNKGMTRIYFDAGMDALKTCIKDMNLLKTIGNHFSCNVNDLPHTLEVRESNELALKNKISKLVSVFLMK